MSSLRRGFQDPVLEQSQVLNPVKVIWWLTASWLT